MIFSSGRGILSGLIGASLLLVLAGCKQPLPRPAEAPRAAAPAVTPAPVSPPLAAGIRVPVSKPRPPADGSDNMAAGILNWDALAKVHSMQAGETNALYTFNVTNVSAEPVMIYDTSATCDCTVAQLPSKPWTLAPGNGGRLFATLDLRGRTDSVTNYVIVFTSKGNRLLTVIAALTRP